MNGNWNGISNQRYSQEQIHQKVSNMYQDGAEPSIDVINTIIASYAASTTDERPESRHGHAAHSNNISGLTNLSEIKNALPREGFTYDSGCRPDKNITSTPIKERYENNERGQFVHPYALKLQKESRQESEDAESNAATDQSENRSDDGDNSLYRETQTELQHSISVVTKKLHWATAHLEEISSIDGSMNAVRLVSECAQTIANLKKAKFAK